MKKLIFLLLLIVPLSIAGCSQDIDPSELDGDAINVMKCVRQEEIQYELSNTQSSNYTIFSQLRTM